MKKFVALVTLILGAASILTAFNTVEEPEPECVCGAAGPLRNKTVEEQELERFLKDFPYKVTDVQKMILYVASEKDYDKENPDESYFAIKLQPEYQWRWSYWPIIDFPYEEGYEYVIEVFAIDYFRRDDVLYRIYKYCRILSKQKKQSENLPR